MKSHGFFMTIYRSSLRDFSSLNSILIPGLKPRAIISAAPKELIFYANLQLTT